MKTKTNIVPALLGLTTLSALSAQTTNHPNVIYVFPDQFRNCALHFWNDDAFKSYVNFKADPTHTPQIDKFAHEAVVLSSAQSNCPLSSPHRAMLFTGLYPDANGVMLNCLDKRPVSNLRVDVTTISDVFSRNGYDCGYIGKYHLDYPTPNNPQHPGNYVDDRDPVWDAYTPKERRHGFNYWYSYGTFDEHKNPHYWDTEGNRHDPKEWSPKHEADKAIEYLTSVRDKNKPFFLVVSMNPPHSPYQSLNDCMEEDFYLYKDIPLSKLLVRPNVNPELTKKQKAAPYYFANISGVDREFGRILSAIKAMGLDKNTIVVFSSDHGETLASHVEDAKNSPYTEAMNVPFIIRYPEKLKPHVSKLLLSTPDIMPTLLTLAGLKSTIPSTVEGTDLSEEFIRLKPTENAPKAVLYIRDADGKKNNEKKTISYFPVARGLKTERYTLALTIDKKSSELAEVLMYDDLKDPYQMNNLPVDKNRELFNSLCSQLPALLKKANDPWFRERILSDIIPYQNLH
ncbi:MAG: sulfatase [Paludibacter sp.]